MNDNTFSDNKTPIININYTYEKEIFELKKEVYSCFNKIRNQTHNIFSFF